MSSRMATMRDSAAAKWEAAKPIAMGLAIGLIAGPMISGFSGYQVRTSTADAAARAGIVEQQAAFCVERARAAGPMPTSSDWQARTALAQRWSVMPGGTTADPDVVYACSSKLTG